MSQQHVYEATAVDVAYLKTNPPMPIVQATGIVRTSGWTGAVLAPRIYVKPPADGVQDLDFYATPPSGPALQVLLPIYSAPYIMETPPDWLRGFRVHAERNAIERLIYQPHAALVDAVFEDDAAAPAPMSRLDDESAGDVEAPAHIQVDDEVALALAEREVCHRFKLLSLRGWPEVKTEFENKCVKVFGKKICTKVPVVYRRSCELVIEVEACWPSGAQIGGQVEDCAKQALTAGVLAGLFTGNLGAATATLTQYLRACLAAKGVDLANQVRIGLRRFTSCGPWKPV